jgi:hypothetical protein
MIWMNLGTAFGIKPLLHHFWAMKVKKVQRFAPFRACPH